MERRWEKNLLQEWCNAELLIKILENPANQKSAKQKLIEDYTFGIHQVV